MGQVVWEPGGGQDGHPLLQVVLLALLVNHQDGDVVATLFHLVENTVSIIFEGLSGTGFFFNYMFVDTVKSSCHGNSSLVAAFVVLER